MLTNLTRSSAVAKRPRDASCLYSFYTLEWCGYPIVKKIRTYVYSFWHDPRTWKNCWPFSRTAAPYFCFPWRRPWGNHAKCCMDGKRIRCLQIIASQHLPIYLQQFPSLPMIVLRRLWLQLCVRLLPDFIVLLKSCYHFSLTGFALETQHMTGVDRICPAVSSRSTSLTNRQDLIH